MNMCHFLDGASMANIKINRFLFAFAIALSSLSAHADQLELRIPQNKTLDSVNGHYVFGQISKYARHQYMLDTKTGKLWIIVKTKFGLALEPIPYLGAENTFGYSPENDNEYIRLDEPQPSETKSDPNSSPTSGISDNVFYEAFK